MNKEKCASMKCFVNNLNNAMSFFDFKSLHQLADFLGVNLNTLKSWMYFKRIPSLQTLDIISNRLNIYTEHLIDKNIKHFSLYPPISPINDSHELFVVNLRKFLNKYDIKSAEDFNLYLDRNLSIHTYYSYFKLSNYKSPSLITLELLAKYFYIQPYQLIERTDKKC